MLLKNKHGLYYRLNLELCRFLVLEVDLETQLIFAVANMKHGNVLKQNQRVRVAVFGASPRFSQYKPASSAREQQTSRTNNDDCVPLRTELEALASPSV